MASSLIQHKPSEIYNSGTIVDHLSSTPAISVKQAVAEKLVLNTSSGNVNFGATDVQFTIPREGLLNELVLKVNYSQGSGETLPNDSFYLSLIESLEIRIGGTTFRISNYEEFIPWVMHKMKDSTRRLWEGQAGTSSSDYNNLMIPIWTPWSRYFNNDPRLKPLPTYALETEPELILSFKPGSAFEVSGTIGGIDGSLEVERTILPQFNRNEEWTLKSYDVQQGASHSDLSTSEVQKPQSHISGSLAELYVYTALDSVRTALDYATTSVPTALRIMHNGTEIENFRSANEIKVQMAFRGDYEVPSASVLGEQCVVYFSPTNQASIAGHGFAINRGSLETAITTSGDAYGRVFGIMHALYKIKNGRMTKVVV